MPASLKSRGIRHWMGNTRKRGFLLWTGIAAGQTLQCILWIFIFFSSIAVENGQAEEIGGSCAMTCLNSVLPLFCIAFYQNNCKCSRGSEGCSLRALTLVKQLQNPAWQGRKIWTLCSCKQRSSSVQAPLYCWGKHFASADYIVLRASLAAGWAAVTVEHSLVFSQRLSWPKCITCENNTSQDSDFGKGVFFSLYLLAK